MVQICTAESGVCCTCLVSALYFKCSLSAIGKDVGKDMGYSVFRPHDQGLCVMTTAEKTLSGMILSQSSQLSPFHDPAQKVHVGTY